MDHKQILLIGDERQAKWHPLGPMRKRLEQILGGRFRLVAMESDESWPALLDSGEFAACISYADLWKRVPAPRQTAALLKFVAGGGGLLAIHNGISLANAWELLQVIGAKFAGHPPSCELHFRRAADDHPILRGVQNFAMKEEPYRFEFDPCTPRTLLLEYEYEGKRWPSAWEHRYGLGRVVYFHPGHTADSLKPEAAQRFVANSVRWIAGLD